ncbi:hypothetical protein [Fusobacterium canifelinum]|uniref:Uncharacterized protein n=1 Tax=Fusobacterium canifelinum TaxID=285729 RepID=A0ABX7CAV0_9FUSO|nr:hypothetical protein [Fusobacterium canifelinum]QQS86665.1 hypothetical protein I6I83_06315 [Fusobacterium canifelinum]
MNNDFNSNIPDFSTRKKVLKIILFLLIISLAILVIQLFFKESLSFTQGNLAIINSFVAFFGSGKQKVKIGDYPIMEIYNNKGEKVLKIPLSLKNYWLMKKYFLRYRVNVNDIYVE